MNIEQVQKELERALDTLEQASEEYRKAWKKIGAPFVFENHSKQETSINENLSEIFTLEKVKNKKLEAQIKVKEIIARLNEITFDDNV